MDFAALDGPNEVERDVVVEATRRRVALGQFDLAFVDVIDGSNMGPVRADDLGVFLDLRSVTIFILPVKSSNRALLTAVPGCAIPAQAWVSWMQRSGCVPQGRTVRT